LSTPDHIEPGIALHATATREKIKTGGICHIALDVTDLRRSVKFYTDLFDMDVVSSSDNIVHLKTSGADDSFFLFKADAPVGPEKCGMRHMHFGFRISEDNFDRAMEFIKKNNIKIHPNPARKPGRYIYIEDPDGYVIQLEPREGCKCGG
jgi:catechol 2,3-dioxygenase-like lactoylglutathione lyase family enzyme